MEIVDNLDKYGIIETPSKGVRAQQNHGSTGGWPRKGGPYD